MNLPEMEDLAKGIVGYPAPLVNTVPCKMDACGCEIIHQLDDFDDVERAQNSYLPNNYDDMPGLIPLMRLLMEYELTHDSVLELLHYMDILDKQDYFILCADANGKRDQFMSRTLQNLCGTKELGMRRWPSQGFATTSLEVNDDGKEDEKAEDSSGDEDVVFVEEVTARKGSTIGEAKKVEDADVVEIDEAIGGEVDADADGSRNAAVIVDGGEDADVDGSTAVEVIGDGFEDAAAVRCGKAIGDGLIDAAAVRSDEVMGDGCEDAAAVRSEKVMGDGLEDAAAVRFDEVMGDGLGDADAVQLGEVIGDRVEVADKAGAGEMMRNTADIVATHEAIGVVVEDADAGHLSGACFPPAKRLKFSAAERQSKGC